MPTAKELDPSESLSALFGAKLRKSRHGAGLTRRRLGAMIPIAHSVIARFELGTGTPTRQVVEALDRLLAADGDLVDLWLHVVRTPIPDWARKDVRLEAEAHVIQKFATGTMPGLLQTEAYAEALLDAAPPRMRRQTAGTVKARLARQEILYQASAPALLVIIDEGILRRPVGSSEVMRAQLGRLLSVPQESANVGVRVLPFPHGAHPIMSGSTTVLSFLDRPAVTYLEHSCSGELVEHAATVAGYIPAFDHLQARALPYQESADLIRNVMEDGYRDPRIPTRPRRRRLAQVQPRQPGRRGPRRGR